MAGNQEYEKRKRKVLIEEKGKKNEEYG